MAKRTNRELIAELREKKKSCGIASQMFNHDLPREHVKSAEAYTQKAFENWWDSWIVPLIDDAERRLVKPRKKKP